MMKARESSLPHDWLLPILVMCVAHLSAAESALSSQTQSTIPVFADKKFGPTWLGTFTFLTGRNDWRE